MAMSLAIISAMRWDIVPIRKVFASISNISHVMLADVFLFSILESGLAVALSSIQMSM